MNIEISEFMPLFDLAKLVVGQPLTDRRPNAEAMSLIGDSVHERSSWGVTFKEHEINGGDASPVTYDKLYNLPQFIEWAWSKNVKAPGAVVESAQKEYGFSKVFEYRFELDGIESEMARWNKAEGTSVGSLQLRDEKLKAMDSKKRMIISLLSLDIVKCDDANDFQNGCDLSKEEQRVVEIVQEANERFDNRLMIPDLGKKEMNDYFCENALGLFTPSTFEKAWQKAKRLGLIEIENIEKYK